MLSVLHAPAWYPPYSTGGTESYVVGLVQALERIGIHSAVAVPRPKSAPSRYQYKGTEVRAYSINAEPSHAELRGMLSSADRASFQKALEGADVYHQHAWTRGCGLGHLKIARQAGLPTVVTAHVPGVNCLRGTMMEMGRTPCDGRIGERRCGACWAAGRGAPEPLARLVTTIPRPIARHASWHKWMGRASTLVGARALASDHRANLVALGNHADRVIAVARWLYDALAANGILDDRLTLLRQALDPALAARLARIERKANKDHRFGFIGRWDPVKGIDTAVRAFRGLPPATRASLLICAAGAAGPNAVWRHEVEKLASGDRRISLEPEIPNDQLASILARIDTLLVPSRWLETGPMVVLEALASGARVIGSDAGGIREWAESYPAQVTLAPIDDIAAWTAAMEHAAASGTARSSSPPSEIHTTDQLALEMARIYRSVLR